MALFSKSNPTKNKDLDGRIRIDPFYHEYLIGKKKQTGISIKVLLEKAVQYAKENPEEVWGIK